MIFLHYIMFWNIDMTMVFNDDGNENLKISK